MTTCPTQIGDEIYSGASGQCSESDVQQNFNISRHISDTENDNFISSPEVVSSFSMTESPAHSQTGIQESKPTHREDCEHSDKIDESHNHQPRGRGRRRGKNQNGQDRNHVSSQQDHREGGGGREDCAHGVKRDQLDDHQPRGRGRGNRRNKQNSNQYSGQADHRQGDGGRGISGPRQRQRAEKHRQEADQCSPQKEEEYDIKHRTQYSPEQGGAYGIKWGDQYSPEQGGACDINFKSRSFEKGGREYHTGNDRDEYSRGSHNRNRTPTTGDKHYHPRPQGRYSSGKRDRVENPDIKLSKQLSFVLRHAAEKEGFKLMEGGFLYVDQLLEHYKFNTYTTSDVERVVETNEKKRFHLETEEDTGKLKIRANQGHSLKVEGLDMTEIASAEECPIVVHGTYTSSWEAIRKKGLSRMRRNHIHCAPGEPGETNVISGMRANCDLIIYIDLESALKDGLKFFKSANNVILAEGDKEGFLLPKYFKKVVNRRNGTELPL